MLVKITKAAAKSILGVMKDIGLDPQQVSIFLDKHKDGCAFEFTRDKRGNEVNSHGLKIQVGETLSEIEIDYAEIDGRKGLVFYGL